MYITHCIFGKITTIDHMIVPSSKITSIDASQLFFSPNCKGVKAKLKIRLKINGKIIMRPISFLKNI
jgi:hypothetical protein